MMQVTGKGPLAALSEHLSDPIGEQPMELLVSRTRDLCDAPKIRLGYIYVPADAVGNSVCSWQQPESAAVLHQPYLLYRSCVRVQAGKKLDLSY
jgi:hypothetical protein